MIVSSKVAEFRFYDELGEEGIATSYEVAARHATTNPYLRLAVHGKRRVIRAQFPEGGIIISDTIRRQQSNKPATWRQESYGAESSRGSSPRQIARLPVIASSKVAAANAFDEFGKKDTASSYQVVGRNATTDLYLRPAVHGWRRKSPTQFPSGGSPISATTC